ncbi:Na+/H+ antiporter NhaC family protein [Bowmanella pacifica]|uniref:Sodium:proton antiporter n=1 Tax=Bowmanella pacifica TaxID=502051 RepID=A0A918DJD8_9ALTE|nr:Na+/H+ antiporter NhaC family protein [Bowmanella pacifica]GGO69979.1 sodium:proton antiporter [Bowmanella pacifica]
MLTRNSVTWGFLLLALAAALLAHNYQQPVWKEQSYLYETFTDDTGRLMYRNKGDVLPVDNIVAYQDSPLRQANLDTLQGEPEVKKQWVQKDDGQVMMLQADFHYGMWSLLPAFVTIALCLICREPIVALFAGIVTGAFMIGQFDITDKVLIPSLATPSAAGILILYLWLLGGLTGIWAKTGAAQAFAQSMTRHFVRGPRSAKLVTWLLGVIFFQGGTISTVLVGTTVRPIADKAGVSHEELSYVVDSTASPIAAIMAFNAWPAYVQAFLFVPGVAFLATEADRIAFFFDSIPFSFYAILAVFGTLLMSLNIFTFSGRRLRQAHQRAASTGQLDAPTARPMSSGELHKVKVPEHYRASLWEFVLPLFVLLGIAVGTFVVLGTPKVNWAFGTALLLAASIALVKGMTLEQLLDGFGDGLKSVVVASIVLMLAVTIGGISKYIGGGLYMVDLLGESVPFWALPVILQLITMVIAFSTGTSWGTYAIAFPLAMPLAWVIAQDQQLANPELYMAVCFATVLNGSVYGDQCSPISDSTILSAMTTGCDLMDHVKSQLFPAGLAAGAAAILWTLATFLAQ